MKGGPNSPKKGKTAGILFVFFYLVIFQGRSKYFRKFWTGVQILWGSRHSVTTPVKGSYYRIIDSIYVRGYMLSMIEHRMRQ